jgi:hypothetical protein
LAVKTADPITPPVNPVSVSQFDPLLNQSIHWFTRHGKYESDETMCLLDAIFDAICDAEDASLRCLDFLSGLVDLVDYREVKD